MARKVETYDRFQRHIRAWVDREVNCLIILGPPGVGKSHAYRSTLGNRPYHHFSGRLTPISAYCALHDFPHRPVVLDDISALLRSDNFRDMLKSLCESGVRTVRWGTLTPKLEGRARSFTSTAPVLIVLNKIPAKDPDVAAVLDRCDTIIFDPTKPEIIRKMRESCPADRYLIDLLAEMPAMPSFRTLEKARRWQKSEHLNLLEEIMSECGVAPPIARLAEIIEQCDEQDWCSEYVKQTGLTERSYRRHKHIARQLVDTRKSQNSCPNVRKGSRDHPSGQIDS